MRRLSQLDDRQRTTLGSAALGVGLLLVALGVIVIHYALFPSTELVTFEGEAPEIGSFVVADDVRGTVQSVEADEAQEGVFRAEVAVQVDFLGWIPRGWLWVTLGQLVAFAGVQLMIFGAAMLWVANRRLTWARATFAAFLVWIEMAFIFGIVPSEWLNLTQGPLEMTSQRIAFGIPSWLVLGNEVNVSFGALKDAVSAGYNTMMLLVAAVFAYKLQDWRKAAAEPIEERPKISPYGRPLVRSDR